MNRRNDPSMPVPAGVALPTHERARSSLALVHGHGFQAIDALALRSGVTPQTIRRDANLLCSRGLCRRRHGSSDLLPGGENLTYPARQVLHREAN